MGHRNIILTSWLSRPFFPAGTGAPEKTAKDPDLDFLDSGTFEGAGGKDLGPLGLADWPKDGKAPNKPPSGKSAEKRERIEGKGTRR